MEIERKWMVSGWPQMDLPVIEEHRMQQGYVHADAPIVRIREEARTGGETVWILCIKSAGRLAREEIEVEIPRAQFADLSRLIEKPLIRKLRRTYQLPDGMKLEVSHVDEGFSTEFWYAEIEYESEEQARSWTAEDEDLAAYLGEDVTDLPGQSMASYWIQTRLHQHE